ncbi:heme ABC transporter permease [Undibacterium flavidum]|uniref:Heme exporter protein C n=1 Tax=Undibacterium flavidum TaxID=2762297 RepID=A0ABR6Y9C6_9BURK|nr:heme ABC transporter permease [Undibacterium flavidum]MBC3873171.1 heme ABC transporter permease [Undibacterium flavidum]
MEYATPVSATQLSQNKSSTWLRFAAPQSVFPVLRPLIVISAVISVLALLLGLYVGFFVAPEDHQQGQVYRIIFIHVPAAWLSMVIYLAMCFWSVLGLVLNTKLSSMMAQALAPTGALMSFLALWTGAVWGRPTWGAWWVWDARLTSELILLFLYLGFITLHNAIDDKRRADKATALLAIIGVINVPIIYFSVVWWNTLHQGASVSLKNAPSMASSMLTGMLIMTVALWSYAVAISLGRLRAIILERESQSLWLTQRIKKTCTCTQRKANEVNEVGDEQIRKEIGKEANEERITHELA